MASLHPDLEPAALRASDDRYVSCPNCAGPVNIELAVLKYANHLAGAIEESLRIGGPAAVERVQAAVRDFIVETNGIILHDDEEHPYYGRLMRTVQEIHKEARAAPKGRKPTTNPTKAAKPKLGEKEMAGADAGLSPLTD